MKRIFDTWLVLVILAVSLGLNVYFAEKLASRGVTPSLIGASVSDLTVQEPSGATQTIRWSSDERPVLLYVFAPSCIWCRRNMQNLKALSQVSKTSYRFIGLSLSSDGLTQYIKDYDLSFPIYVYTSKNRSGALKVNATPETFMVLPNGKIKEEWVGAYSASVQRDIEQKVGVRLPGLLASVPKPPIAQSK